MVVLAWAILVVAWFVVIPFFLSLPSDYGVKWWEPYVAWAGLNAILGGLIAVACAIGWAIGVVGCA